MTCVPPSNYLSSEQGPAYILRFSDDLELCAFLALNNNSLFFLIAIQEGFAAGSIIYAQSNSEGLVSSRGIYVLFSRFK